MRPLAFLAFGLAFAMLPGCASIVNDSTNPIRLETFSQNSKKVKGSDRKIENDYGASLVRSKNGVENSYIFPTRLPDSPKIGPQVYDL